MFARCSNSGSDILAAAHQNVRHYKGGMSSAIHTGRIFPRRNAWYSFSEAESTPRARGSVGGSHGKNPQ